MLVTLLDVPLDWQDQSQFWLVILLLAAGVYIVGGYIFRSVHPTGRLNWQGRRWRKGVALLVLLSVAGFEALSLFEADRIGVVVAAILYAALGLLFLLLARWWWRDRQKEKAARDALVEKLRSEGRELAAPPMSTGKKAWRWVVNGYAIFLVAAALYALIHYLVLKFL